MISRPRFRPSVTFSRKRRRASRQSSAQSERVAHPRLRIAGKNRCARPSQPQVAARPRFRIWSPYNIALMCLCRLGTLARVPIRAARLNHLFTDGGESVTKLQHPLPKQYPGRPHLLIQVDRRCAARMLHPCEGGLLLRASLVTPVAKLVSPEDRERGFSANVHRTRSLKRKS